MKELFCGDVDINGFGEIKVTVTEWHIDGMVHW